MPGYGASSKEARHAVDLATQGELFAHLRREWALDSPQVRAHDLGGAVALRARLLHGARYASLCLVDVVALSPWGSAFFRLVQQHAEVFAQLPPGVHRGAVEAYIHSASHRGLRDDELAVLVEPGQVMTVKLPSTVKLRKLMNASPTRSNRSMELSKNPCT